MENIFIKEILPEETLPIRHSVLWPDKPMEHCIVEGDDSAVHFGLYLNNVLIAVASTFEEDRKVRLRKFAVSAPHQGSGFGTLLLEHAIHHAKLSGAVLFWCDAREDAINFYKKFGLEVDGDRFYKSDLPYYKMAVKL